MPIMDRKKDKGRIWKRDIPERRDVPFLLGINWEWVSLEGKSKKETW